VAVVIIDSIYPIIWNIIKVNYNVHNEAHLTYFTQATIHHVHWPRGRRLSFSNIHFYSKCHHTRCIYVCSMDIYELRELYCCERYYVFWPLQGENLTGHSILTWLSSCPDSKRAGVAPEVTPKISLMRKFEQIVCWVERNGLKLWLNGRNSYVIGWRKMVQHELNLSFCIEGEELHRYEL